MLATFATIAFVAPAGAKTDIIKHDHGHHWQHDGGEKIVIKRGDHH